MPDVLNINISVVNPACATIKMYDSKGALVKQQAIILLQGNNLISIDVKGVAAGLYLTTVSYGNENLQTQKIIKIKAL